MPGDPGPGAIHLLNGLYDAKMDHQSVVAIVGQQARRSLGSNYQQEVDLAALFKDVASSRVLWAIWWKTSCHRQNGAAILCNSTVKPIQVTLKLRKCDMALLTTIAFPGGE